MYNQQVKITKNANNSNKRKQGPKAKNSITAANDNIQQITGKTLTSKTITNIPY